MSKIIKNTIIFSVLVINICFSQQTLKRELVFENDFLDYYPKLIEVDKVDNNFNGYLVIHIKDQVDTNDKSTYKTKIFWLESMDDLNNYENYYWYQFFNGDWLKLYNNSSVNLSEYTRSFIEYYTRTNDFYRFQCTSYLYSYLDWLETDILDSTKIWSKDKVNLLVFKTSFSGALTKALNSKQPDKDSIQYYYKTLIPITGLKFIRQISDEEARQMNLEQSNLRIQLVK
ncbi:MAG: hypothetical protein K8I03_01045 [Ignavibacteria bacterium]|nr:hypothetical protein [Ignavibacteria bacterium]